MLFIKNEGMGQWAIEVKGLKKSYNGVEALKGISFSVKKGELFGLIGPDGAGKTSLFRILTSLLLPTEGAALMEGYDCVRDYRKIRSIIGYMPGRFSLYQDLSVQENLNFFATVFGTTVQENYHLIQDIYVQIEPFKNRPAGKLSGGMKQKLALCCALIHKPKVLLLDEPTTGVDVVSRKEFWEMLKKLKEAGIAILVSTPYMDEASLCDRVALIQEGNILSIDTPQGIIDSYHTDIWAIKASDMYKLITDLKSYPGTHSVYAFGEYLHFIFQTECRQDQPKLLSYLEEKGNRSVVMQATVPTIEDCFMALM